MYGLQHGALANTEQQAIKGPKITSVKPFKRENQRSNCQFSYRRSVVLSGHSGFPTNKKLSTTKQTKNGA